MIIQPTPRLSVDKKITALRHKTLNLCNDNDLRMLNGIFGKLFGLATTSTGLSVVDYVISSGLMSEVLSFKVENFDPPYSNIGIA